MGNALFDHNLLLAAGFGEDASTISKYGRATDVDSGSDTDIWDRANSTDAQKIWTAPAGASVHNIASDNVADTAGGAGCRQVQLFGLTSWDSKEVSEIVTLNGTSDVPTVNSYVIIHRMKAILWGSSGPNQGKITATATVGGTITAQIAADEGQTQMAIYGVPSVQTAYMSQYYASAIKASASLAVAISMLVNPIPDEQLAKFIVKHTNGLTTEGTNYLPHKFGPYFKITGPAIIKIQGNASANNVDVSAGFDLILIDN